ncbi:hypothetical protein Vafri_12738 [Volvox africanus]|uniref:Metallo-beta-lactamase domain-containing protein n=1 Tax=Volvox africanus TaxID=51714 RepID=A0A8J4F4T2_9CHLO|nr:hypothetical protein Vafri_12738 [Volvox africanus]
MAVCGALMIGLNPLAPGSAAQRRLGRDKLYIIAQAEKTDRRRPQGDKGSGGGNSGAGSSGRRRRPTTYVSDSGITLKQYVSSDGQEHLGTALQKRRFKPFPGPPPGSGPPLRILPIGGLGEIGMNCMLAGVRDRFVVIDAGLMFPDFSDLGMQKILPDTDFLAQWKDRIEALIITHGHEDHIGALPWVVPALDPSTPIYASSFVMELIKRRLMEYNLWDEKRFIKFEMRQRFQAGPFDIEPVRVTHSIPDCCGLIMRSSEGTLVHTGDWKIDEQPLDGEQFDRELFMALGSEPVALMMSDSTNVLSPGRTLSEQVVHDSIVDKVLQHNGKGRVICTQFASNVHRLYGVKRAADASGRKICFVGASLSHYLEASWRDGRAPFNPKELVQPEELRHMDPNQVLIVTTGSQGEPRAQLCMAAREESSMLKILPNDLVLYSAKVIPGNEGKVSKMLNALAAQGARVRQSRADNLHTSGHAYQEELVEVLQSVRPQHFLPVHGEYAFLTEHALLARERAGVNFVDVIRNGEMLAVRERRNRNTVSAGSMAAARAASRRGISTASLSIDDEGDGKPTMIKYDGEEPTYFFNDGGKGTGTRQEMEIDMRNTMAVEGVLVAGVEVLRAGAGAYGLTCRVRVTSRGIWTDGGRLLQEVSQAVETAVMRLPGTASLVEVERVTIEAVKRRCVAFNNKRPEVIAIPYEHDPRDAHLSEVAETRRGGMLMRTPLPSSSSSSAAAAEGPAGTTTGVTGYTPRRTKPSPWEAGAAGSAVRPAAAAAAEGTLVPGGARRSRLPRPAEPQAEVAATPTTRAPRSGGSDDDIIAITDSIDEDDEASVEDEPVARSRRRRSESAGPSGAEAATAAAPEEEQDEDDGGGNSRTLGRMLRVRKAAGVSRQTRINSDAPPDGVPRPPPLRPLDPRIIQDRRRRNPRDQPSQLDDPDYG